MPATVTFQITGSHGVSGTGDWHNAGGDNWGIVGNGVSGVFTGAWNDPTSIIIFLQGLGTFYASALPWDVLPTTNIRAGLAHIGLTSPDDTVDVSFIVSQSYTGVQNVNVNLVIPDNTSLADILSAGMTITANLVGIPFTGGSGVDWAGATGGAVVTGNYILDVALLSVSPTSGPASGGTAITITGRNLVHLFYDGSSWRTSIGSIGTAGGLLSFVWVDSETITAVTPASSVPGAADINFTAVGAPADFSAVLAGAFTYFPTTTSISPGGGTTKGGTVVTIHGSGFISSATVQFDGVEATNVVFVNSTTLTAKTPAGTGRADVTVTETVGGTVYTPTLVDGYIYESIYRAPILSAGSDSTLTAPLPKTVSLVGTWVVEPVAVVGVLWTQVAGPATIAVTSSTSMTASVTFTDYIPGAYIFKIESAADPASGVSAAAAQVTITIPVARAPRVSNLRTTVKY